MSAMTVHYMEFGQTLCNKPGTPKEWEDGHFFITNRDRLDPRQDHDLINDVNCEVCEKELRARGLLKRKVENASGDETTRARRPK